MHTRRDTASFITILLLTYGFAIGGLASPAAAHRVVVTMLTDTARILPIHAANGSRESAVSLGARNFR